MSKSLKYKLERCERMVRRQVYVQTGPAISRSFKRVEVWDQVVGRISDQVGDQVYVQFRNKIWDEIWELHNIY